MAVSVHLTPGYLMLRTDQLVVTEQEAGNCISAIREQNEHRPLVILDFTAVGEITPAGLRMLTRTVAALSQHDDSKIAMVAKGEMIALIREQGLDRLFSCYSSLSEVIGSPQQGNRQATLEFLNTTLEAVSYTLKITTSTEVTAGKPYPRGQGPSVKSEIAAVIGIVSGPFNGSLILGFGKKTYLSLMSRMLGGEYSEITPDIRDGVAELLNIILGQAKTSLNDKGFAIKQAIPTVVHGSDVQILPSSSRPSIIVPYTSEVGDFYVELTTNPEPRLPIP